MDACIVDYGLGNLFSLQKVFRFLGAKVEVTDDPVKIRSANKLILPGVGAFEDGIHNLKKTGLDIAIKDFVQTGKPLLGICLGMQLLMDESEENGLFQGLGIIPGRVVRLEGPGPEDMPYKIPHVGWNRVFYPQSKEKLLQPWDGTIFGHLKDGSFIYFVHSYQVVPSDQSVILSETVYGRNRFCSALQRGSLYACQFHPEVSGGAGLQIMDNFLKIVK
ncbi:MAG: imidazole glycerol phosphate synthase subunit HisH [Candidatus Omnitrophica bacterium]|nr:imidazole glycerol phosphate synthase subunit HisH [Candidatus Omnitrophota bacterium]